MKPIFSLTITVLKFTMFTTLPMIVGSPCNAQFRIIETDKLRLVYYGAAQSYIVNHTARCFHNSLAFHESLFDFHPKEKTTVAVYDPSDFGNAGAGTVPWNAITLAIAPPSYAFETTPSNERINATMHHEIVHLVAGDKSTSRDRFFRGAFFGKVAETSERPETILYSYLTTPRRAAPRWYHEGIAVFLETWMSGGLGRALGSYDEMVFRTIVRDSATMYDVVGLESEGAKIDFQVGAMSYLYGGRFLSYMALRNSPEELIAWVSRTEGSRSYFASQFSKVYGISLDSAWRAWISWEHTFQSANLDTIRQYPITQTRKLTSRALGSVSRPQYDEKHHALYVAVNYPGQVGHLAAIHLDNGHIEKLCDIKGAALYFVSSIAFDAAHDVIFFTTDNTAWRDLWMYNTRTREKKELIRDARVGDLSFNPVDSSLWGVRNFNGITTIVRIPHPYTAWNQIYSWPYGRDIYNLDVSPDGKYLSAGLADVSGRQCLIRISTDGLRSGDTTFSELYDFHNSIAANFVHSSDGHYLYGTSYVSGVSNVFRYDLVNEKMEALSNVENGLFNPLPLAGGDSLVAFEFTHDGFAPVELAIHPIEDIAAIYFLGQEITKKHPIVTTWLAGSPGKVDLDTLIQDTGNYHGLRNVRVAALYPIVEGYREMVAYGFHTDLRDPLNQHRFDFSVSYSPDRRLQSSEKWHTQGGYSFGKWEARATLNDADFYDLFGPTKSSRKGYSLGLKYSGAFIDEAPKSVKYKLSATRYGDLEKLPEYQNITTSFDRFWSFGLGLTFSDLRASLGAVDHEKGASGKFGADGKLVNGKFFTRVTLEGAAGLALPLHHSAFWFRGYGGYSPDSREEPLANFYFGGFGNNWVDNLAEKRYRDANSFPGVELNALGGNRYIKGLAEWTLPPLRFRHVGSSSLYVTWARPSIFAAALVTNPDHTPTRRKAANVGAQTDFRFVALSHLNMTLSFGYAAAFQQGYTATTEFMASLKIL